jgi:hypothetical protein
MHNNKKKPIFLTPITRLERRNEPPSLLPPEMIEEGEGANT